MGYPSAASMKVGQNSTTEKSGNIESVFDGTREGDVVADMKTPDFSVVLFRSDCMLVSEGHHMKTHKNQ